MLLEFLRTFFFLCRSLSSRSFPLCSLWVNNSRRGGVVGSQLYAIATHSCRELLSTVPTRCLSSYRKREKEEKIENSPLPLLPSLKHNHFVHCEWIPNLHEQSIRSRSSTQMSLQRLFFQNGLERSFFFFFFFFGISSLLPSYTLFCTSVVSWAITMGGFPRSYWAFRSRRPLPAGHLCSC